MAEETQTQTSAAAGGEVAVTEVAAEKKEVEVTEKKVEEGVVEEVVESEKVEKVEKVEEEKIGQSASFKEESNVVGELPDPQKKALDELKALIRDALDKHEFSEEKKVEEKKEEVKVEEEKKEEVKAEEKKEEEVKVEEEKKEEEVKVEEVKTEEKEKEVPPPEKEEEKPVVVVEEKVAAAVVDEDGAKTVEAIEETIVPVAAVTTEEPSEVATPVTSTEPAAATEEKQAEQPEAPPSPPEEVSIFGIPLLADERSDTILLKFLRARDFKVKDAFTMIKNTVRWRKEFGIESLLEEDLGNELEKVFFMDGLDKEGHPICYNVFGEFQNKELYQNSFSDEEKRTKFLRWRIQFLEKSIRKLDFSPSGICTIVQVNDLKNSPGPSKRELRVATNQAVQLLQDNYPEFVAKQVYIFD